MDSWLNQALRESYFKLPTVLLKILQHLEVTNAPFTKRNSTRQQCDRADSHRPYYARRSRCTPSYLCNKERRGSKGKPGPIDSIETIHYARWVIIDGGTRLLFTSNYDGNLEDYLAEFAERDEGPLNIIFSQCVGWPGARPVGPFIQYVKEHMVPAEYYHSAYPRHTVKEIKRALYWKEKTETFIREHLQAVSDFVLEIREHCSKHEETEKLLERASYPLGRLDEMRNEIRTFLKDLAAPTPEDFNKKRPKEVSS